MRSVAADRSIACLLLSFAYLAFAAVLRLLLSGRSEFGKDLELLVLRHQLLVRGRQERRPSLRPADRACFCRAGASPAAGTPARLDRDATDAFALASAACASQVDATAQERRPAGRRRSHPPARAALRTNLRVFLCIGAWLGVVGYAVSEVDA